MFCDCVRSDASHPELAEEAFVRQPWSLCRVEHSLMSLSEVHVDRVNAVVASYVEPSFSCELMGARCVSSVWSESSEGQGPMDGHERVGGTGSKGQRLRQHVPYGVEYSCGVGESSSNRAGGGSPTGCAMIY
jgi:hypothetical protein